MDLISKIKEYITNAFTDDSYFIVDVQLTGSEEGKKKVLILLDSDNSINIDECASVSRQVARKIEEEEVITTEFIIEVSSPGLDRPFTDIRQFKKNIGKRVQVLLKDGKIREGRLEAISESQLTLGEEIPNKTNKKKVDVVPIDLLMADIKKTTKVVSFK